MPYASLFFLHLLAVTSFVAILLLTGFSLPRLSAAPPAAAARLEAVRLRRMNLYVASPALLLLWACGLAMAVQAGWYAMGWLKLKALLVLLASAIHGRQMASLRRIVHGSPRPARPGSGLLAAAIVVAAAFLALAKPF